MSEEITEVEDTKQSFDYLKEREERIKNKAEKAIFKNLELNPSMILRVFLIL